MLPVLSPKHLQTINDYFDKEIDAINEPYRPIPSGACMCLCERFCLLQSGDALSTLPQAPIPVAPISFLCSLFFMEHSSFCYAHTHKHSHMHAHTHTRAHTHAGRITEDEVKAQIFVLLGAGIGIAYLLDTWVGHDFPQLTVRFVLLYTLGAARFIPACRNCNLPGVFIVLWK
jgi:hypothetical protein